MVHDQDSRPITPSGRGPRQLNEALSVDVTRVVPVPLPKDPAVLWGLSLKDLVWIALGIIGDLLLWPHSKSRMMLPVVGIVALSSLSIALAVLRYQDRSIPSWCLMAARFYISAKRYTSK